MVYYKPDKNIEKLKMHEPILTKIADDMAGLVNFILADCNVI